MKTIMIILFSIVSMSFANAQTPQATKKAEMKDLKKDVVEKKDERKEMGKDLTHAKFKHALHERKEVRADKKDIKHDEARLENQGVKHPVAKVKHDIKADKERKQGIKTYQFLLFKIPD